MVPPDVAGKDASKIQTVYRTVASAGLVCGHVAYGNHHQGTAQYVGFDLLIDAGYGFHALHIHCREQHR